MTASILVLVALLPVAFAVDCSQRTNGDYEIGCRYYVQCRNGQPTYKYCPANHVFNSHTQKCADPTTFTFSSICTQAIDCTRHSDGRYADLSDKCHTYYTCSGYTFFGHNYCPGGTVFNEKLQLCDFPNDVYPPCGTKGLTTPHVG